MPDQRAHEYYLEQAYLAAQHGAASGEALSKDQALELAKEVQHRGGMLSDTETRDLGRHLERLSRGISHEESMRLSNLPAHPQQLPTRVSVHIETLEKMTTALQKCHELMDRHLAAGQQTVPARALYFILRDAGYGMSRTQKQEVEASRQTLKQTQEPTNQLHHNYAMRQ
jgi:hypothetical protein